ncbi:MAG: UDP-N-acetylmuramate dehydrogenase [Clostridia bacterium]|nr:UDP-N-acetylmuramate dehydrogenase [Clostridia bacterium]
MTDAVAFCEANSIPFKTDLSAKTFSTFKIGGIAPLVVYPTDTEQVSILLKYFNANNLRYKTVGNCSNVLFSDNMLDCILIKTDLLSFLNVENEHIVSGSGNFLSKLASAALKNHLSGMEKLFGIPGSVGGAVIMNAGAFGAEMSQIVEQTEYVDAKGNIHIVKGEEHCFGYRKSCFTESDVVTKTTLKLIPGIYRNIREEMNAVKTKRVSTQPLDMPSAGSVFKRPDGHFAGKLIEDCGLKGFSVGGAQVSTKHAGFIVNTGNATAADVKELINLIQSEVFDKFGLMLETEIRII